VDTEALDSVQLEAMGVDFLGVNQEDMEEDLDPE
jgi:hypothetical protein